MAEESNSHTILFVDDEQNILSSLKRLFRKEGYTILATDKGVEALEFFKDHEISLIISDQRMPAMSGVELLAGVKKISPETIRIMLTGYADIKAAVDAINTGEVYRFIGKPWNDDDIKLVVRDALRQLDLKKENERLVALTDKQNEELKRLNSSLELKVQERTRQIEGKNVELKKLYSELKKGFFDTIKIMVGIMELLNQPLGGHSKRVAVMSKAVARKMGVDANEVAIIEIAALLHDIGLMGLPASVISQGMKSLNDAEREIYREHPVMGQSTLNMVKELKPVGILVRSHHERVDGKGFPAGLIGEEIPLGSRIIAVADAYDEIAKSNEHPSERVSRQKALEHLKKLKGFMFDPDVVEQFLTCLEEAKGIARNEKEISLKELKVGMITSRNVYTQSGKLLLARNVAIEDAHLKRIISFDKMDPIKDAIYVIRDK